MFICPCCGNEVYVDEDGFVEECISCEDSIGDEAIYVDDSIQGI